MTPVSDFLMPSLGADMDEGTLLEWLVKPGDRVNAGDPVAVIDTAKAAIEVETFDAGVIADLLVEPGTKVAVGTPLAHLRADGAAPGPETRAPAGVPAPVTEVTQPAVDEVSPPAAAPPPALPRRVTPLVRKRAHELGIDLTTVVGTGRGGAITRSDVDHAAHGAAVTPPASVPVASRERVSPYARRLAERSGVNVDALSRRLGRPVHADDVTTATAAQPAAPTVPLAEPPAEPSPAPPAPAVERAVPKPDAMRAAIADLMSKAKREIPHYYLQTTVDLTRALAWMEERNKELDISHRLVPSALVVKAVALAAAKSKELNGFWRDGGFVPSPDVHVGMAVSLRRGGMVAPAIHHADRLDVVELMTTLRDVVTRVRAGRLKRAEMADPTITVTNLGDQGVELVYGVIYPPQVALVGVGRVEQRVTVVDGLIGVRPTVVVTLSADHRATDGFVGARFLRQIDRLLQTPEEW